MSIRKRICEKIESQEIEFVFEFLFVNCFVEETVSAGALECGLRAIAGRGDQTCPVISADPHRNHQFPCIAEKGNQKCRRRAYTYQ